jgi:hypothetical protein
MEAPMKSEEKPQGCVLVAVIWLMIAVMLLIIAGVATGYISIS